jgi:hypothetical protein
VFNGPELEYSVDFVNGSIYYMLYSDRIVDNNFHPNIPNLIAFHQAGVDRNGRVKMIFGDGINNYLSYGSLSSSTRYQIDEVEFMFTYVLGMDIAQYFNVLGFDILVTQDGLILFANLDSVLKSIPIYYTFNLSEVIGSTPCDQMSVSTVGLQVNILCLLVE